MPRKAKDETQDEIKKTTTKRTNISTKKSSDKKNHSTTKKSTSVKNNSSTKKSTSTKKSSNNTSNSKKNASSKPVSTRSRKKSTNSKESQKFEVLEYYDLPYRYNQTIVKILAQTPSILFVYWDISDIDRKNFELQYGQDFFSNTKPILTIHNIDKNYSFELDINDFANSWYIHISDSNCKYTVELGRKPITYTHFSTNYIYVTTSNLMDAPNNHILFENMHSNTSITYKNMKNKTISYKKLGSLSPIYKVSNINKLYENIYGTKILEEFSNTRLNNPSSGSISGAF